MADDKDLERVILARVVRLNAKIQGLVTGLAAGLLIFRLPETRGVELQ